jgi:ABC-2 type transport system permease protein
MRNVLTIAGRELKSYFASPVAYGLMTFFAALFGFFFYAATAFFVQQSLNAQFSGRGMPMDVNEWVIRGVLSNISVIGLFLIPMISMRLFAEEKRAGTIELLVTSPVRDMEIILGKWLAAMALYLCVLAISLFDIGLLFFYGKPDWKPILVGYVGLILQGGALLAIGIFISSTTRNQIIAGTATFAVCLLLWVLEWVSAFDPSPFGRVVSYLSVLTHFEPFAKGVLDTKDIIFYITLTFFGLFLTSRSLESLRWRA